MASKRNLLLVLTSKLKPLNNDAIIHNPNTITDELIDSIIQLGIVYPLVCITKDKTSDILTVVDGVKRLEIAKLLGIKRVYVMNRDFAETSQNMQKIAILHKTINNNAKTIAYCNYVRNYTIKSGDNTVTEKEFFSIGKSIGLGESILIRARWLYINVRLYFNELHKGNSVVIGDKKSNSISSVYRYFYYKMKNYDNYIITTIDKEINETSIEVARRHIEALKDTMSTMSLPDSKEAVMVALKEVYGM